MKLKLTTSAILAALASMAAVRYVDDPAAAAPAAAAPAPAAAPAAPVTPTPAAGEKPGAAAAPPSSIVGDAKPAAAAAPVEPTADEQKTFLTTKGVKAEDLAKLDPAGVKAKFDELKTADAKAEAVGKIEIKVPEGAVIDEKQMTAFKEILADEKLSTSERGTKLAEMHAAAVKAAVEGPVTTWMNLQTEWQAKVKADPEMGGANYEGMTASIAKAIDEIGGKEAKAIREAFVFTGAGNEPNIVRLMYRMSKAITEGKMVSGAALGAKTPTLEEAAQRMYPTMQPAS